MPQLQCTNKAVTYPGGKSGAGVYQTIINQIPPHETYMEPFAGGAGVYRHIRRAQISHLVDLSEPALKNLRPAAPDTALWHQCGIDFLANWPWTGREFVYCDPPYVRSSRQTRRDLYDFELTDDRHASLLAMLQTLPVPVALSGYRNPLYDRTLRGWRAIDFTGQTRGGPRTETLWMNYPTPAALHDYRYLGRNFRERARIKKKATRWAASFLAMPDLERQAVLSMMLDPLARRGDGAGGIAGIGGAAGSPKIAMPDSAIATPGEGILAPADNFTAN